MVNRGLAVFVSELEDETGGTLEDVLLAYVAARDSFGLLPVWAAIEAVPASVPGELQTRLLVAARGVSVRGTRWFMTQGGRPFKIRDTVVAIPARHRDGHGAPGSGDRQQAMPARWMPPRATMSRLASHRSWPAPSPACRSC